MNYCDEAIEQSDRSKIFPLIPNRLVGTFQLGGPPEGGGKRGGGAAKILRRYVQVVHLIPAKTYLRAVQSQGICCS